MLMNIYTRVQDCTITVNPSGAENVIYRNNLVNTIAADALAPYVARLSTRMELIKQNTRALVVWLEERFLLMLSQFREL